MTRFLLVLGLIALALPAAAQGYGDPYYGDPYERTAESAAVGVRLGAGVGAYVYQGPDIFVGPGRQDDVVATNLAVTGEISFPLGAEQLRGRLLGGLLNIGADDDRLDSPPGANPFLTSQTILAEADLMYYLAAPGRAAFAPYVFTGVAGLFATGDALPGVNTSVLAIPVGVGAEFALSRNLSLYGEASYRFGVTEVSDNAPTALANASVGGPCAPNDTRPECKPCPPQNPTHPNCPVVDPGGDERFDDSRFNSALFTGGLRLGFSPAPRPYVPVPRPYYPPPPVVVPPPALVPPAVCDLIELNPVYFDYGASTVSARARALLDENVELLLANPECCVFIDGTIDNQEMDRFGMPLGGRRAQAVYDYYLGRGVSASKLQIRNRGEGSPNCDKEDPGIGCERNRRVETLPVDCDRFLEQLEGRSSSTLN